MACISRPVLEQAKLEHSRNSVLSDTLAGSHLTCMMQSLPSSPTLPTTSSEKSDDLPPLIQCFHDYATLTWERSQESRSLKFRFIAWSVFYSSHVNG